LLSPFEIDDGYDERGDFASGAAAMRLRREYQHDAMVALNIITFSQSVLLELYN
jgi:hypothetical protein